MSQLFRFSNSVRRDPAVEDWIREHAGELGAIAQRWFEVMRHVKLRPQRDVDARALMKLIEIAYTDMKGRLKAE